MPGKVGYKATNMETMRVRERENQGQEPEPEQQNKREIEKGEQTEWSINSLHHVPILESSLHSAGSLKM